MEKQKVSQADQEAFYTEERNFLNSRCDLPKLLLREGWVQVPSRFKDTQQFHRKGRIVEVTFHQGQQAYEWKEAVRGRETTGFALGILGDRGLNDEKQRFYDALDAIRTHVYQTRPKLTEAFYTKNPVGQSIFQEVKLSDYQRVERKFLRSELSIFKVANELGYSASEAKSSKRTYFRKGDAALSINKKESGNYLWYDHDTSESGFVEHLVARDIGKTGDHYGKLIDLASRHISSDKLEKFLAETAGMALESPSLRAIIEGRREFALKASLNELQAQYSMLHAFQDWSADHVLKAGVLRHYRIPELHPGYLAASESFGVTEAKTLVRMALLREASIKIPREYVSAAAETEVLKPAIRSFLSVLAEIQNDERVSFADLRKMVKGYKVEQEMVRPIQITMNAKANGLSI